ncbi:unnamed protein product [Prorocentrum cordatum]|uniref:Dynactin subunit 6 n=1 Tax=Prorocentrum cordatum TaxID=2364126 RepID=A0ABN9UI23_9DINO|nr:unnamed protein product [Polarella glacialis]
MVHLLGKSAAGGADASTTWLERSEPASSHVTSGRGEEEEEEEGGGGRRRARAGRSAGRAAAAARGHRRRPPPPRRGADPASGDADAVRRIHVVRGSVVADRSVHVGPCRWGSPCTA